MGKQINYYMEYESFLRIAEKAVELGCEILRNEHTVEICRGFSADVVTPECKRYFFFVPEAGTLTFGQDMYGKRYVKGGFSASGNALIEADYSFLNADEKRISRARIYCITGYYDENQAFISRPDCVTAVYNALARYVKKLAPYTELTKTEINAEGEACVRKSKQYITESCRKLLDEGYHLC